MPSIIYQYGIGQNVFQVDSTLGVRDAVVRALSISVTQAGSTLMYDIAFTKSSQGSANVAEPTLYPDVDTALAAYRSTVLTS